MPPLFLRLQDVAAKEGVSYDMSGLEAIVFVAEGDMRNALNSMQSTVSGFGHVSSESVFKVCCVCCLGMLLEHVGCTYGAIHQCVLTADQQKTARFNQCVMYCIDL